MTDRHGHHEGNDKAESVSHIIERLQCQSKFNTTWAPHVFISVVVKDIFMIPEHVVHCSGAALHSQAICLQKLIREKNCIK